MRRQIIYELKCMEHILSLGDLKRFDEKMAALEWALWLDAEDFPIVDGFSRLRVARLEGFGITESVRVFFEIEDGTVAIKWVEPVDD